MEVIILRICKTIRAMVCCIFMLLLMTTAFAETKINDSIVNDGQEQRYSIISGYDVALSKNGSTATGSGWIRGTAGTSKVYIKLELQEKNGTSYSTIRTWTKTVQSNYAKLTGSNTINTNKTYRLKATFTATKNGSTETATIYKY